MRTLSVSSLAIVLAYLFLSAPAVAEPCSMPGSHKGHCYCKPPLTKECGPVWNEYFHRNFMECWCHNPAAGDAGYGGGSYGHAEVHKKNVPQTHPTPGPGMLYARPYMHPRGAVGMRMMRRPATGVMRRWQ